MSQSLWGLIEVLQLILITYNLPLKLSPEAALFVSHGQELAQVDVLAPNYAYFGIFFSETEPFSESYSQNGHDNSTFILLMGGFVTLYITLNVVHVTKMFLQT